MEQNKHDEQLKEYFQLHKMEFKDDDFTKRVMQALPRKRTHQYVVYLFLALGVFLFLVLNGFDRTMISISDLTITIPELKLSSVQSIGGVVVFMLVIFSVSLLGVDYEDNMLSI